MTKHGLFLTVPQLKLLRELAADYDFFYLTNDKIIEAGTIIDTLDDLIAEAMDTERYDLPEIQMSKQGNAQGYHKC